MFASSLDCTEMCTIKQMIYSWPSTSAGSSFLELINHKREIFGEKHALVLIEHVQMFTHVIIP